MNNSGVIELSSKIENILKCIPEVCPLQQFVATNPLWNLIDSSIDKVGEKIKYSTMTMSLSEYLDFYKKGQITHSAISQAIEKLIERKMMPLSSSVNKISHHLLYKLMTSERQQKQLLEDFLSNEPHENKAPCIIFSIQIQQYLKYSNVLESIKSECLNWLTSYFNPTDFHLTFFQLVDEKNKGKSEKDYRFFDFWYNFMLNKSKKWRTFLSSHSKRLDEFIESMMLYLSIPISILDDYLFEICWQLKGWIGYIKWNRNNNNNPYFNQSVAPIEIVAIWLAYEAFWFYRYQKKLTDFVPEYWPQKASQYPLNLEKVRSNYVAECNEKVDEKTVNQLIIAIKKYIPCKKNLLWLWQHAYELSYQQPLYKKLLAEKNRINATRQKDGISNAFSEAQWVFCIDVRSEGLRRYLEKISDCQTFGFAGFFGFAHQLTDKTNNKKTFQCPVLIEPVLLVDILSANQRFSQLIQRNMLNAIQSNRKSLLSAFSLYEMVGIWCALILLFNNYGKSFFNSSKNFLANYFVGVDNKPEYCEVQIPLLVENSDLQQVTDSAKSLLKSIGLTNNFSEFVIICGHGATTENNPYRASLDCGACGGNAGITNAVLACQVLNKKIVRQELSTIGIDIPNETIFIAAHHDTTTDQIIWYDKQVSLSRDKQMRLSIIKKNGRRAGDSLKKERLASMPGDKQVVRRSKHWAELIPEWGLANNAAMIIAPRELTKSLDLDRRVFLHDYQSSQDPDGTILESILLGPAIVAHWINSQYYFSSVDPDYFGSGNKAIHNVLPYVGVMEGNQSDLKYGLPIQSVFYQQQRIHQPRRLCIFIDADKKIVLSMFKKHAVLEKLILGQWVSLELL